MRKQITRTEKNRVYIRKKETVREKRKIYNRVRGKMKNRVYIRKKENITRKEENI